MVIKTIQDTVFMTHTEIITIIGGRVHFRKLPGTT